MVRCRMISYSSKGPFSRIAEMAEPTEPNVDSSGSRYDCFGPRRIGRIDRYREMSCSVSC
jgi:hypothetical protein